MKDLNGWEFAINSCNNRINIFIVHEPSHENKPEELMDALENFYEPFKSKIDYAYENMGGPEIIKTGETCPKCGKDLVKRQGKYGEFICCENRPDCDYIKPKEVAISENAKTCPKCKEGKLIVRKSKYGNFLGCSRFPECDYMESFKKKTYYKKKEN